MTRRAVRALIAGLVIVAAAAVASATEVADPAPAIDAREGQVLDLVELGTGKRLVRPTLEKLVVRDGKVVSLRLNAEGEARAITVLMPAIIRIVADRETICEADFIAFKGRFMRNDGRGPHTPCAGGGVQAERSAMCQEFGGPAGG
ncbi:MAG: hypothetical protein ACKOOF_12615 [Planctomycetaceae bacterium]